MINQLPESFIIQDIDSRNIFIIFVILHEFGIVWNSRRKLFQDEINMMDLLFYNAYLKNDFKQFVKDCKCIGVHDLLMKKSDHNVQRFNTINSQSTDTQFVIFDANHFVHLYKHRIKTA